MVRVSRSTANTDDIDSFSIYAYGDIKIHKIYSCTEYIDTTGMHVANQAGGEVHAYRQQIETKRWLV